MPAPRALPFLQALSLCLSCIMLQAAAQPLELPADPDAACNRDTFFEATSKEHACSKSLYHRDEAVESCCIVLAQHYGPNSTLPTRNCFCVEGYWAALNELSNRHYIAWATYLDKCTDMGHTIHYFQDGEGPCAGPPPADAPAPEKEATPEEEVTEQPEVLPMRTFGGWLAGLDQDGWGAASFTVAILAALGSGMMAWSFVFDACADLRDCWGKKKSAARYQ